ncbi:hypothetical protein [Anaerobacillus alkalilacustris]|uniref:hypothetical protein n=1 Tax=Anaerobacillus alkalilacustris TaxID=393763 RepID=UPI0011134BDC|nr:hypothetical protein [Anaerobacillus alkalilacustris]
MRGRRFYARSPGFCARFPLLSARFFVDCARFSTFVRDHRFMRVPLDFVRDSLFFLRASLSIVRGSLYFLRDSLSIVRGFPHLCAIIVLCAFPRILCAVHSTFCAVFHICARPSLYARSLDFLRALQPMLHSLAVPTKRKKDARGVFFIFYLQLQGG